MLVRAVHFAHSTSVGGRTRGRVSSTAGPHVVAVGRPAPARARPRRRRRDASVVIRSTRVPPTGAVGAGVVAACRRRTAAAQTRTRRRASAVVTVPLCNSKTYDRAALSEACIPTA